MKIVVRDLTGFDLDYWVAKLINTAPDGDEIVEVFNQPDGRVTLKIRTGDEGYAYTTFSPTSDWYDCGPLLETGAIYELEIDEWDEEDDGPYPGEPYARAKYNWLDKMGVFRQSGPLKTAICRAFVASKKGWSFEDEQ